VMAALDSIERLYASRGAISGLSTGFADLDRMTDGLHPGEMIVIAARPSMGKTALAMNMAEHIAVTQGKAVAVFSAEMSAVQLHQRLICSRARVNLHRVREGFLMDGSFPAITRAATEIAESQLFIVDAVAATINAVRAKARRLHRKHGLSAIFVDYLQLLHSRSAQSKHNREREISEISQGLKSLGKELDVPIVVLSQLNRNADGRTGSDKGRPMLSDLRESGSIEQDADFVGLLMREEYYVTDEQERLEVEGRATLIIAKQRNGPVGDVRLMFLKEFMRFEDREKKDDARGD
jgi:replicative DNA helicase